MSIKKGYIKIDEYNCDELGFTDFPFHYAMDLDNGKTLWLDRFTYVMEIRDKNGGVAEFGKIKYVHELKMLYRLMTKKHHVAKFLWEKEED